MSVRPDWALLSLFLFGDYEPATTRILRRMVQPGDTVVDVGAYVGWYSLSLANSISPTGRVVAFEPLFGDSIRANLALNDPLVDLVEIVDCGLGDRQGSFAIYTFNGMSDAHASATSLGRDDAVSKVRPITTLDAALRERGIDSVELLKVDVEGHERDVFLGAKVLLNKKDAPIVYFEINQDCLADRDLDSKDVHSVLAEAGFGRLWRINPHGGATEVSRPNSDITADYICAKPHRYPIVESALRRF